MSLIGIGPRLPGTFGGQRRAATYADYQRLVLADKPQAYWPMNDAYSALRSGGLADLTGNGYNPVHASISATEQEINWSTTQNVLPIGRFGLDIYGAVPGGFRQAAANNNPKVALAVGANFSVEAWVLVTGGVGANEAISSAGYCTLMGADNSTGANTACFYFKVSNQNSGFNATTSRGDLLPEFIVVHASGSVQAQSARRISRIGPHHIVGTWDGQRARLYVDGTLWKLTDNGSGVTMLTQAGGASFSIFGGWYNHLQTDAACVSGSDWAVYPYALSAEQIARHWRLGMLLPPLHEVIA